jgi:hypothetical protein
MTQASTNPTAPAKHAAKPRSNIYTVLTAITMLVLAAGVAYLWYANTKATGDSNPFTLLGKK